MPTEIQAPNRLFFLNTGVLITPNPVYRRRWEANRKYGFVSAGQNLESGRAIQILKDRDIVCAYISKYGFVGIGRVNGDVKPIGESFLNPHIPGNDWPLINHDPVNGLYANMGNLELQEYIATIEWLKDPVNGITTAIINPYSRRRETIRFCSTQRMGFNIYPGVCCELLVGNPNQQRLIEFIKVGFDIRF